MQRWAVVVIGAIAVTAAMPSAAFDLQELLLKKIAARATPIAEAGRTYPDPMPIAPPQPPVATERERDEMSLDAPTFDSNIGGKALKTRFSAGGISGRVELGYDGDLRLRLDKSALGGRLSMSFVDDAGGNKLRLEFKSSF